MIYRTVLALVLALTMASPSAAVTLDPSPDAQGRSVINALFRDYIAQRVGIQIETGVVDVEGDGVAEIVARFVHSGSCRENSKQCRTVVVRHDNRKWGIILDRLADKIDVPVSKGNWNFTEIQVDDIKWAWNGRAYAPVRGSLGEKVAFSPVPADTAAALAAAFGPGAVRLAGDASSGVSFEFARPKVSETGDHMIVRMKGAVACGDPSGCPIRLLRKEGESWHSILDTWSVGDVEVSKISREGRNDIVVGTKSGFAVLGWAGKAYGIADVVEATAVPK